MGCRAEARACAARKLVVVMMMMMRCVDMRRHASRSRRQSTIKIEGGKLTSILFSQFPLILVCPQPRLLCSLGPTRLRVDRSGENGRVFVVVSILALTCDCNAARHVPEEDCETGEKTGSIGSSTHIEARISGERPSFMLAANGRKFKTNGSPLQYQASLHSGPNLRRSAGRLGGDERRP